METSSNKAYLGHLFAFSTILISSFNTNFMKVLLDGWITANGLVVLRALTAVAGFWLVSLFVRPKPDMPRPGRRDILMMMLGLVGEYVGRMYMTMNKSPQYVVRATTAPAGEKGEAR